MAGRNTKLTKDLIKNIFTLIASGNYDITVFEYLNISSSAYYEWLKKGKDDLEDGKKNVYTELVETVQKAKAAAEIRSVGIIQKASETHWQAAAWLLERKYADRWRQQIKTEFEGLSFNIIMPEDIKNNDIEQVVEDEDITP